MKLRVCTSTTDKTEIGNGATKTLGKIVGFHVADGGRFQTGFSVETAIIGAVRPNVRHGKRSSENTARNPVPENRPGIDGNVTGKRRRIHICNGTRNEMFVNRFRTTLLRRVRVEPI